MLTIGFENDKELIKRLAQDIDLSLPDGGAIFTLREDEVPVGIMRVEIGKNAKITHLKVKNEHINPADREFFLRAMLFKFSLNPMQLWADESIGDLSVMGFEKVDGGYRILSSDIRLSGHCKDKN